MLMTSVRNLGASRRGACATALICGLAAVLCGCKPDAPNEGPETATQAPRPDIIFMLIDTLRADGLGVYGNPRGNSPQIDAIGREGAVFERAIAPSPWTQPSVASLFCSRYPSVHKVLDYEVAYRGTVEHQPKVAVFSDKFETLAESLRAAGYQTAAFVANPFVHPDFGFAQGFDHFDCSFGGNSVPANVVNDAATAWLEKRDRNKPLFLFLHYMDPHGPYDTAPKFLEPLLDWADNLPQKQQLTAQEVERLGYLRTYPTDCKDMERHERLAAYREYWVARYEAGIRQFDHFLGDFRRRLEEAELWDNAYVLITSDHGEALGEHGHWGHGVSTQHPELHVPLIVRWPGTIPAGVRVEDNVELMDLMPTMLDQLALPAPPGLQGDSLLAALTGEHAPWSSVAFAEAIKLGPEQKAIYVGHHKLMMLAATKQYRLFDVAADPLEQNQIAAEHAARAKSLAKVLDEIMESNAASASNVNPESKPISAEHLARLRSLGYTE